MRPVARWFADDQVLGLGNTAPAPDVAVEWDTAGGAESHLAVTIPSGAGLIVASDASTSRAGSLAAGATYLGVCSDDAASPTECVTLRHDGPDAVVQVHSGALFLEPSGGTLYINEKTNAGAGTLLLGGSSNAEIRFRQNAAVNSSNILDSTAQDQLLIGVAAASGWHAALTAFANTGKDHDHTAADSGSNPALYVHSALDPDTDNTRYGGLWHTGTAGAAGALVVKTGAGPVQFDAANDTLDLLTNGTLLLGGSAIVSTTFSYNTAAPVNCGTVADGYAVTAIWSQVTVVWNGTTPDVQVGDGDDVDGFYNFNLGAGPPDSTRLDVLGYKATTESSRGAYLYTGGSPASKVYALADQIDCTPTAGDATQGAMTVYIEITRLK